MSHETRVGSAGPDILKMYLDEIGPIPVLTREQEVALAQRIELGVATSHEVTETEPTPDQQIIIADGLDARQVFIRSNLKLVVSVAKKYTLPDGLERMDLIQEGNTGMEHAVDKFEWEKGFKFSTYATWWIRQAINRCIKKDAGVVRLPEYQRNSLKEALKAVHGDPMMLSPADRFLYELVNVKSFDQPVGDNSKLEDVIPDTSVNTEYDAITNSSGSALEAEIIRLLEPDEAAAIIVPKEEVSEHSILSGLNRNQLRALKKRAQAKLLHPSSAFSEQPEWTQEGQCYGAGTELFFVEKGTVSVKANDACRGCKSAQQCIEFAMMNNFAGVWGGTSERQRKGMKKAAA